MQHIVIVGGGAGGLQLATRLGHYFTGKSILRRRRTAPDVRVTLVDRNRTHIWKPLLHQVATGSLDSGLDALNYHVHARKNGFRFELGHLQKLDRQRQVIELAPVEDADGRQLVPARELPYDQLVIALGSHSNDFNTPGVREHCVFLDSTQQAQRFHQQLLDRFLQLQTHTAATIDVAIVGGGATGVELAAELVEASGQMARYGHIPPNALQVTLIEAGAHLLPALPARLGNNAQRELTRMGVRVMTGCAVKEASDEGFVTAAGDKIPAAIRLWAAGVKAPEFLRGLDGLTTNRINQIKVNTQLQSVSDGKIFALGDCAGCVDSAGQRVPPRAQAAQQMAGVAEHNLIAQIEGRPLQAFRYRDHGSLVSLSKYTAIGNLMGALVKGSLTVEGRLAGVAYRSLYRMHLAAVHGWAKAMLIYVVGQANRFVKPRMKLH
ncbi:NADH dehydrogenase [Microbulbifer aestuariivivens]|uniref:NADH dehydrogenase n=1 Tax=Microbulbifer aestuariivivens TaxID=1908308 RepID=A0ABP9WPU5_9GAMM